MAKYYESDITKMLQDLLIKKPHIAEEQRKGRALWWDKNPDADNLRRTEDSRVRQQAYVYQNKV